MAPSPLLVAREMPYADLAALVAAAKSAQDPADYIGDPEASDTDACRTVAMDLVPAPDDTDEDYDRAMADLESVSDIILSRLGL